MENRETKLTRRIYTEKINEWDRLVKDPFHKLEYDTTLMFLKKYLPPKGLILDAGGGPGRYTVELAKMGYDIMLMDLVPGHLEIAKKKIKQAKIQGKVKGIVEGSITDLSGFKDKHFDAVICLGGPLSHVHPAKERAAAVSELIRVAKKNAPVFISVMGKFGTIARFLPRMIDKVKDTAQFKKLYLDGDDYRWYGGKESYAHFFELNELKLLFANKVKFLEDIGLQGLSSPSKEQINTMAEREPAAWKNWLEMHYKLCTHPTVVESSLHFMVIGRKK
jgi:ubiquinone/menaquinone biosynthesis C-methylase UbiE